MIVTPGSPGIGRTAVDGGGGIGASCAASGAADAKATNEQTIRKTRMKADPQKAEPDDSRSAPPANPLTLPNDRPRQLTYRLNPMY